MHTCNGIGITALRESIFILLLSLTLSVLLCSRKIATHFIFSVLLKTLFVYMYHIILLRHDNFLLKRENSFLYIYIYILMLYHMLQFNRHKIATKC